MAANDAIAPVQALAHRASFVFAYQLDTSRDLAGAAERYHAHLRSIDRGELWDALEWCPAGSVPKASEDRHLWKPVEREAARRSLNSDLLPLVDRLLHGSDVPYLSRVDDATYAGHSPLVLLKEALGGRFWIQPGPAATARMQRLGLAARAADLGALLDDVRLYTFASGIVLLAIDLRFFDLDDARPELPLALIEEAIYALGHPADRSDLMRAVSAERRTALEDLAAGDMVVVDSAAGHGVRKATAAEREAAAGQGPLQPRCLLRALHRSPEKQMVLLARDRTAPLGLHEMAQALAGCAHQTGGESCIPRSAKSFVGLREMPSRQHGRVFTFTAAVCDADAPGIALDEAAYRLSRRFTTDYALESGDIHRSVLRPFDNVFHAMATQGGALVVRSTGAQFVESFVNATARTTYIPLALVSYHEYLYLLHLTQGCAFVPDPARPEEDKQRIRDLRYQLAKFRLYFRFSHVSDISHHNQVHDAWRRALDLDRLLQDLSLDVREADQVLDRHHHEQQLRRWRLYGAAAGGLAGFIGIHEIAEAVQHAWAPDHKALLIALQGGPGAAAAAGDAYAEAHRWHEGSVALALLAAVFFAWVAWHKGPRLEE